MFAYFTVVAYLVVGTVVVRVLQTESQSFEFSHSYLNFLSESKMISGISEKFSSPNDFSSYLDENFSDFKFFAEKQNNFYAKYKDKSHLVFPSFSEFLELQNDVSALPNVLKLFFEDFKEENSEKMRKKISSYLEIDPNIKISIPKSKYNLTEYCKQNNKKFRDYYFEMQATNSEALKSLMTVVD
jgi:hypothetical protein